MFREIKRAVMCGFLGGPVDIVEVYQVEGTGTCQVEVNPFHWRCSESNNCRAQACELQRECYLLKQNIRGD